MQFLKFLSSSSSWSDLNKKLEELTKSGQAKFAGSAFELLVKYYLLTNPRYQSKLKNVWLLNEVKEGIKKKLNLPDQDEGIDIIAETKEGHFWAIQAKYRSDANETLTLGGKGSLATFSNLAFRYCKNITHGLVCTTVNKPPKKIKLIKQVGFETLESFLSLDDNNCEEWKLLVARSIGKIIKPQKLEPRPHQIQAIKKTVQYFKSSDRGKVIMPCGTGKSLAAFWIANEMKAKNILIAVPSLALLQQTLKVWTREFLINNIQPDWLCVCSDDTVKEDQDSFVSYTYDLGIEVTTNKDEIRKFLKNKSKNIKVIFTTYQSGRVMAQGSRGFTYDLGIMDEAHKTVGHQDKPMAHLLHQKNIRIKHRLFMTATERLFRANKEEYLSMDDERDYGKIIYELTFKDAINSKPPIISDYKIITFGISEPEIEEIYQDNKFLQVKKELKDITAREFATALALRKAIKDLKITNAISFHSSIKRAVNFKDQQSLITKIYPEYGSLKTFHVRGDMPTSERSSQMRLFEEGKGLMTNARCLTEGVDLPAIDCVCFTDPKRSKVDIVQAAGRALRLSPGKKFGYILIPIFIPADQDPETASKDNAFEEVVATVGALSTQDTRIAEYLRAVTVGRKPTGGSPVDGTISVNVLTKIDPDLFNKAIQLKIWDKIAKVNFRSYLESEKYARSLKLSGEYNWRIHTKSKNFPQDIPTNPHRSYKAKGWKSWGVFLGTGTIAPYKITYKTFILAKKYARSLKLSGEYNWRIHTRSKNFLQHIPKNPNQTYKNNGWKSWGDFLGTGSIATYLRKYKSYKKVEIYAHSLKFKNQSEWFKHAKSKIFPEDIPKSPNKVFDKNGWKSWGDFLGTGFVSPSLRNYRSYKKALNYAKSLKLKNFKEWISYSKLKNFPKDIPSYPHQTYKKEWNSYGVFLGTGRIADRLKKFISYKHASKYAVLKKIKSEAIWRIHTKSKNFPKDIPKSPSQSYKNKGWKDWPDFLGTGRKLGGKKR
jgi:superfamily II DNA or RNA helicase